MFNCELTGMVNDQVLSRIKCGESIVNRQSVVDARGQYRKKGQDSSQAVLVLSSILCNLTAL